VLGEVTSTGNVWELKHGDKPLFQGYYQPRLRQPEPGTYYKIIYRDSMRIIFQALGLARICENVPGEEIPSLLDILEPGDIWEIIRQGYGVRVWRKITFPLFLTSSAIFA
jgi:hypothetical protein